MPLGDTTPILAVAVLGLVYNEAYLLRHHHTNITTPFPLPNYYKSLKALHYTPQKSQRPLQSSTEASSLTRAPLPSIDIANTFLKLSSSYTVSSECRASSSTYRPELLMWTNRSVAIFHSQRLVAGKPCSLHLVFKALFWINMWSYF